ncbi:Aste57867_14180 [Aphanomyces stellatus]|uniref:Aste57867_14180 protein n=1 Tax=Aphanomyces stellatus TaxID=120398 RepID=A0A485L0Q4_9STRA|nr:hypothetical protein As57867_014129 [Aphanomyces stellatus]VFT91005.1 Aste57867_14180 [Aphanomyces stellatus]
MHTCGAKHPPASMLPTRQTPETPLLLHEPIDDGDDDAPWGDISFVSFFFWFCQLQTYATLLSTLVYVLWTAVGLVVHLAVEACLLVVPCVPCVSIATAWLMHTDIRLHNAICHPSHVITFDNVVHPTTARVILNAQDVVDSVPTRLSTTIPSPYPFPIAWYLYWLCLRPAVATVIVFWDVLLVCNMHALTKVFTPSTPCPLADVMFVCLGHGTWICLRTALARVLCQLTRRIYLDGDDALLGRRHGRPRHLV